MLRSLLIASSIAAIGATLGIPAEARNEQERSEPPFRIVEEPTVPAPSAGRNTMNRVVPGPPAQTGETGAEGVVLTDGNTGRNKRLRFLFAPAASAGAADAQFAKDPGSPSQ